MKQQEIDAIIAQMSLEEKASLCSGKDIWQTKPIERLGVPACRTSDGPHGLRVQNGEVNNMDEGASLPAVCFPSACCSAASFNRELLYKMGAELGRESQALGVQVLLGPGVNIKRSPLCGRNFEYFSEDPLLAGELGAAYVNGVQSQGVGTSLKHFFANNQEHRRMSASSEMDERTMREIYLPAFETVVKKAQPWTIMAAYNKIGGIYATENKKYLTDVLRAEWGFEGLVVSDWGATHNRAAAVAAGCALTMPSATESDQEIVLAVQNGSLQEEALNAACAQVLQLAFKGKQLAQKGQVFNFESGHAIAREIAEEAVVLLKNKSNILPLAADKKLAFIGGFAKSPRYQGGGSSHITCENAVGALAAALSAGCDVAYAEGYDNSSREMDEEKLAQAVEVAKNADVAVVFAGLTDAMETEGVDRKHLCLPESHDKLIQAVCLANPNTVVVLHNGAPVEMPWVEMPKAILETYLGGQAVGEAVVGILLGKVNPSGHLPETFPKRLADTPAYLFGAGERDNVQYSERFFVGYRYYVSKEVQPLFPFGHGLSYTSFKYSGLMLDKTEMNDTDMLTASVCVSNTGGVAGKVLVQAYVQPPKNEVIAPVRELRAFEKIYLAPGESKSVTFTLGKRSFAVWSEDAADWRVESGNYLVQICENAHEVKLAQEVKINATQEVFRTQYALSMTMGDFAKNPQGYKALDENIGFLVKGMAEKGLMPKDAVEMVAAMGGGKINLEAISILAQRMGMDAGGNSGVTIIFGQPLEMLAGFMPKEERQQLQALLQKLNEER